MITIIQSTNRADSNSEAIARQVAGLVASLYDGDVKLLNIRELDPTSLFSVSYEERDMPAALRDIQDAFILPATKFIWIIPEYNGSFPGVLKLFLDALSVRRYNDSFAFKKSLLIGLTKGRSGNIRGMDHLADVLQHLKSVIYPRLLPISRIGELMDDHGTGITDKRTLDALESHIEGFISF